jgi:hypothetical protein
MASDTTDIVLSAIDSNYSFKNICIGHIEASCHNCNIEEGLFDLETIPEMNTVGNGSTLKAEKVRNFVLQ